MTCIQRRINTRDIYTSPSNLKYLQESRSPPTSSPRPNLQPVQTLTGNSPPIVFGPISGKESLRLRITLQHSIEILYTSRRKFASVGLLKRALVAGRQIADP